MKKIISTLLSLVLVFSLSIPVFARNFSDLPSDHWAFSYVNTLVTDGTINGFEDGTFRPAGTVTRAEFVKMIGCGPNRREGNFDDVPANHWAYEYVMTSGLEAVYDNMFNPSVPITRGEVANLLWVRAGSPEGRNVPPVIANQYSNPKAIVWVYANGVMTGDDNLNLRLSDTLTRAEASALIVRSRNVNSSTPQTNFYSSIDPKIYETVYNSFGLIDKPYSENGKITIGEVAMATARLLSDNSIPDYPGVSATISFDHPYAQAVNMICRYWAGLENDNVEYANKNATVKDAINALSFATLRTSHKYVPYDANGGVYPEIESANDKEMVFLKVAYQNGICFDADGKIYPDREITMKEFACLLLEYDGFSGFYSGDVIGRTAYEIDYKLNTSTQMMPSNASIYRAIVGGVPKTVYEKPYSGMIASPKDTYAVADGLEKVFRTIFDQWYAHCKEKGVEVKIYVCPILCATTDTGYTFRTKVTIVDKGNMTQLSDLIKCADSVSASKPLVNGESFWVDVDSGRKLTDVVFDFNNVFVRQLVD